MQALRRVLISVNSFVAFISNSWHAYVAFEDGALEQTAEVHEDLGAMIRVSSNSAATRLLDKLGMRRIQATLRDPRFGFYDEKNGGGLWAGKRYAASGPRLGDPLYNISHGATVTQVCRFFYLLSTRRLISEARFEQMLADLANPELHDKFVSQIDRRAPSARAFRKSGTWRKWHSDAISSRARGGATTSSWRWSKARATRASSARSCPRSRNYSCRRDSPAA